MRRKIALVPDTLAHGRAELSNDDMSALFEGTVEATEEAIYNSLFAATTVTSKFGRAEAIPLDRVKDVLRKYGITK